MYFKLQEAPRSCCTDAEYNEGDNSVVLSDEDYELCNLGLIYGNGTLYQDDVRIIASVLD